MRNTEIRKEIKEAILIDLNGEYKLSSLRIDYKNKTFEYDLKEDGSVFTTEKGHFTVEYRGMTEHINKINKIVL